MLPSKPAPPDKKCGYLSTYEHIDVTYCKQSSIDYGALCMKSK